MLTRLQLLVASALAVRALAQTPTSTPAYPHTRSLTPRAIWATAEATSTPALHRRNTVTVTVVETFTAVTNTSATATSSSVPSLTVASTVPVAATIGLIMPEPWSDIYAGVQYTLGWVDPGPRPAPVVGGWLREVVPLLKLPNETIDVFPSAGTNDPTSNASRRLSSDTLCGSLAQFNYAYSYAFSFAQTGWHMLILNETWVKPTIFNDTCVYPLVSAFSFFATQTFSVRPSATHSNISSPTSAYTVWADVSTQTPGDLPIDPAPTTDRQALAVGLGVAFGLLGLAGIVLTMWLVRKRRRRREEPHEQAAFLADNPDSWLHPYRQPTSRWARASPSPPVLRQTQGFAHWWDKYGRWGTNAPAAGAVMRAGRSAGTYASAPQSWGQAPPHPPYGPQGAPMAPLNPAWASRPWAPHGY